MFANFLSTIALVISFFALYYGSLHQEDEISVIIDRVPRVSLGDRDISLSGSVSVTFVNGGNRAASVHQAAMHVSDAPLIRDQVPRRSEDASCHEKEMVRLEFGFEPFVVGANNVVIKRLELQSAIVIKHNQIFGAGPRIERAWIANREKSRDVTVCLGILLSTPGSAVVAATLPLTHTDPSGDTSETFTMTATPIALHRWTSNILMRPFIDEGIGVSAHRFWDLMREGKWPLSPK